ncbi:hypothetical protein FTO70_16025 [Methanosarcina sp. KYL-1]|nr:hypothetical protein [Methanosarcina sp. KYL-1]
MLFEFFFFEFFFFEFFFFEFSYTYVPFFRYFFPIFPLFSDILFAQGSSAGTVSFVPRALYLFCIFLHSCFSDISDISFAQGSPAGAVPFVPWAL